MIDEIILNPDNIYYLCALIIGTIPKLTTKVCGFLTSSQDKAMDVISSANDDLASEIDEIKAELKDVRAKKLALLIQLSKTQADSKLLRFKNRELEKDIKELELRYNRLLIGYNK